MIFKIVGVIRPNDLKCHADSSGRDYDGMRFVNQLFYIYCKDFVSVGNTGMVLRENRFQIIFAVSQKVKSYYEKISESWWGVNSAITDLNPDNFNISSILMESKKKLNSKFKITYPPTDRLEILIGDECDGVELGQEVTFGVRVKFITVQPQETIKFDVSPLSVVTFQYTGIGSCPCSNLPPNRVDCTNHGFKICGIRGGDRCECNKSYEAAVVLCTNPNTRTVCSDRGTCNYCGKCSCKTAPDGLQYEGEFCQCGRTRCENFQDQICGGPSRGKCDCDSCNCTENYTGKKCELKNCNVLGLSQNCVIPGQTVNCSELGDCVCGECKCNMGRGGQFCEIRTLPYICSDFRNEAMCLVHNQSVSDSFNCNATKYVATYKQGEMFQCVMIDNINCKIYYNFTLDEKGEFIIHVKEFDSKKGAVFTIDSLDCPKPINVFLVTGCVFAALFAIGFLLIGLYLLAMYLYYKATKQGV
ncbi:hypothetical protein MXB_337 [Myxobolus squamalis]|nr:hypothetical protein MXB_337 [Myxobolus squamalis]